MGYTHYWYRAKEFDQGIFTKVVTDFKKVMVSLEPYLKLAGGRGTGKPIIGKQDICFNGVKDCGHPKRNLGITWPADKAKGIVAFAKVEKSEPVASKTIKTMFTGEEEELSANDSDVAGTWFAGLNLETRTCGGDCSHETFSLPCKMGKLRKWDKQIEKISHYDEQGQPVYNSEKSIGKYFAFCKTAYKPYDLAVIAALIIAKNYLKDQILVCSDGKIEQWGDGILLCQKELGYGIDFEFDKD